MVPGRVSTGPPLIVGFAAFPVPFLTPITRSAVYLSSGNRYRPHFRNAFSSLFSSRLRSPPRSPLATRRPRSSPPPSLESCPGIDFFITASALYWRLYPGSRAATYIYHAIPKEHRWNLGRVGPEVGRVPFVSMTDNKPTLLLSNANTNRNGRCS